MAAGNLANRTPTSRLDDSFHEMLLELSAAASQGSDFPSLIRLFCRKAREFLGLDGVYYWSLLPSLELLGLEADGHMVEEFCGSRLALSDSAVAAEAVRERRAVFVNHLDHARYPMAARFQAQAIMAAPLILAGEVVGVAVFLSHSSPEFFNHDLAATATILATHLCSAVEMARLNEVARQERRRAENLMGLALELSSSLRLPDFVRSFVTRAAHMLGAGSAILALAQEGRLETVAGHGLAVADRALLHRLSAALTALAKERPQAIVTGAPADLLGTAVASALSWRDLVTTRLTGAENELLGLLCLADLGKPLSAEDRNLLQALAGHASVALENSRLFSRIEQSNKHWMEIFDSISDFIVVHDESQRVLRVNHSLAEFIGVRPSELIGMSMRALVPIAGDAAVQPCPLCRTGAGQADEYIHPVLERTYLVSSSRARGAGGQGLETIHVLRDITDRREAERRYRELFDTIQEGIYFTTPEGRFVEVNDALVRMLGYGSREELLQADIPRHLYPAPEQRQAFLEAMEERGVVRNFEEILRRKDGSLLHSLQNAFAVRDAQGRVLQYRGVMLDITELKTFQAQLQRERDFNSKILNSTQSLILVADTSGLVTYANRRCFESGIIRPHHLGRALLELVVSPGRDTLERAFQATLQGQPVDHLELLLARSDGRQGQFSISLSPMRNEQGEVASIIVVMTDVTESAVLQAKLMHAEKMAAVGQLVSGVAHEVNNPLTAILGFADLLLEQPGLPETASKDLQVIVQEAQRTKQIVQNLLSFARPTPAQRQPVDLNSILRRTLQLRAYDFSSHGLEVVERLDPKLPEVVGDPYQLQQVFLNILNNAYDAVRETGNLGRIEVETYSSQDHAEVLFRDNGPGIAFPERIFDPFFTTKEVGKGTGLGLSICYGIVREHGGEITCHNNHGQPGATFIVRLPILAETETPLAAAGAQV